jgi:creatinine amidohydrolase
VKSLFDLPHSEARSLVRSGAPVFLTVNPVEYHGPHLSLHNDRLVSRGLVRDLHARLAVRHPNWPLLLASDLEIGIEPCWGPGSRHTRFKTACELVREACRALAELGAERVVIMTFHGAPLHNLALDDGVRLLEARGVRAVAPFNLVLQTQINLDTTRFSDAFAHIEDASERAEMIANLALDFHAGFFETSVALHYAPESVSPDYVKLPPCPEAPRVAIFDQVARIARALGRETLAGELGFAAAGLGWYKLKPFPGYTGRPHRATPAAGEVFARFMVDEFEPVVEAVLAGRASSPRPIMQWARYASLGGRIGGVKLTADQMDGIDA